jgi:uncharacterized protein (DUF2141 family)
VSHAGGRLVSGVLSSSVDPLEPARRVDIVMLRTRRESRPCSWSVVTLLVILQLGSSALAQGDPEPRAARAAAVAAPAPSAEEGTTGTLEIVVSGLDSDRGLLVLALMDSAKAFAGDTHALRSDSVSVENGQASVTFRGLPYGRYAIKAYHDENSNGKLDTNLVGFPKESFGFSNDAMGRFGPPSFEQAQFEIDSETLRIVIHSN